jgi:hypothetical protein
MAAASYCAGRRCRFFFQRIFASFLAIAERCAGVVFRHRAATRAAPGLSGLAVASFTGRCFLLGAMSAS